MILPASGVTSPSADVSIAGGVSFDVTCISPGGTADISFTLGEHYPDLSQVRIYQSNGSGGLTDITSLVTLSNQTVGGVPKTIVSYTAVDGGVFDEDGVANGTIAIDSLYVGMVNGISTNLSNTGTNMRLVALSAIVLLAAGVATALKVQYARRDRASLRL